MTQSNDRRLALDTWFGTPAGQALWTRERTVIQRLLADCFGHHGLEVGTPSAAGSLLAECTLGHRIRVTVRDDGRLGGAFLGDLQGLALRPRSIVAAVLVHVVDYHPAPGAVLAAAEQALAPGGLLLVSAFNPWSPNVVHAQFVGGGDWAPVNRPGARRCKHWLESLHLETRRPVFASAGAFEPGSARERLAHALPIGQSFVVAARKRERESLAIPMGARFSRRMASPGLPRPTNRNMKDTAA